MVARNVRDVEVARSNRVSPTNNGGELMSYKAYKATEGFHITHLDNLAGISETGLEPRIGERSQSFGEKEKAVFFDPCIVPGRIQTWKEMLYPNLSWEELAILKLDLSEIETELKMVLFGYDFEYTQEVVPPSNISVVKKFLQKPFKTEIELKNLEKAVKRKIFRLHGGNAIFVCEPIGTLGN